MTVGIKIRVTAMGHASEVKSWYNDCKTFSYAFLKKTQDCH